MFGAQQCTPSPTPYVSALPITIPHSCYRGAVFSQFILHSSLSRQSVSVWYALNCGIDRALEVSNSTSRGPNRIEVRTSNFEPQTSNFNFQKIFLTTYTI